MKHSFAILIALLLVACGSQDEGVDYSEYSIAEIQDAMQQGTLSAERLVEWYQQRIAALDASGPELNSIIELNPDALTIARALDDEWANSGPRGPMHGIPVVLKANIDTGDRMATSAGSLALAEHRAAEDAFLVARLRDAGAVILGKANLSEWANFRSTRSSSGWSSVGGQTRNPYDTTRNPCGSSSGSGVAVSANLAAVAVGTETNGSVVCPSGVNGIVGIKPTLGLISRSGIIPIAHSQDTAGPMARSVRDAAILLTAMTGKDPDDPDSMTSPDEDFSAGLAADGLQGKRIGVFAGYFGEGSSPDIDALLESAIEAIEAQGATVIRDIDVDIGASGGRSYDVLRFEFKHDLNAYLDGAGAAVASIDDVIQFNDNNADRVMPIFGQEIMLMSAEMDDLNSDEYKEALSYSRTTTRDALEAAFAEHALDALIGPTNSPAWKTDHVNGDNYLLSTSSYGAISGYPNVTVPMGFVSGLPVGLSFTGKHWQDKALIEIAYAFEQATEARRAPPL
ncbi:MAG: amidase [Pseudomonadota bacterium]